jgi:hypothetical protein
MASSPNLPAPESTRETWLHRLARYPHQLAMGLFAATVLLAIVPAWLFFKYRDDLFWVALATILFPLTTLTAAIWQKARRPGRISETDATRMLVLVLGGTLGLNLLLVSLAVLFQWWQFVAGGMETWQGSDGWRVWVFLILLLAGLGTMFASLQLGRTEERSNVVIRRLLYGYNAVLTGLLLFCILGVSNVLAYGYFPHKEDPEIHSIYSSDWTFSSIYSLSSRSESILAGLNKPARIYVIISRNDETLRRVEGLLDNCRAVTNMLQVEYLSPELDREKISRLAEKYKLTDPLGLLVVYGNEPNTEHQFIQGNSLYSGSSPFGQSRENRLFKGESELMTALSYLSQGKQKPIVYFTQGNGELDLADSSSRDIDQGAGAIKQRLEQDNVTVKGLQFSAIEGVKSKNPDVVVSSTVPKDATVVVIAGPHQTFPDFAVKALRDYMNTASGESKTKGKLIALLDVALTPDKTKMQRTGLEDLLADFGVQVGDNRVIQAGLRGIPPLQVRVLVNPELRSRNPIAAAFSNQMFLFYNVRTVQPATPMPNRPDANRYHVDPLLIVPAADAIWPETQLRTDPTDQVRALLKMSRQEITNKLSQDHLTVGVAVSDQGPPSDPHTMTPSSEVTPRLVAIGDASFVSNWAMQRGPDYDLFYSILSWLRERPSDIGIEAKKQDVYDVDPTNVNFWRMVLLPLALMLVGVIGLGAGVWVVRRR